MDLFSGWGNLVYFDTEEHQISPERRVITKLPKLGSQWKIIHDFKPTEYLQEADPIGPPLGLCVGTGKAPGNSFVGICFRFPNILLAEEIVGDNNQIQVQRAIQSTQLPKVGEWTRIEICHEMVDGKYFLSLSVGGTEVGRKEVTNPDLRRLTDAKVLIGIPDREQYQPGFIRRLVILEKR